MITPTFSDSAADTIAAKSSTEGLTGYMARSDLLSSSASTVSAKIVLSADFSQATIYLDGVNAGTLTDGTGISTASGGLYTAASGTHMVSGGGLDTRPTTDFTLMLMEQ